MNRKKAKFDFSNNRVLTFEQACEYTGYTESYMYKLTHNGKVPYSKPNNKKIFFDRELLEQWMLSNANGTTHELRKIESEKRQTEAATYVTTHQ